LNEKQQEVFLDFLREFQDIFSDEIVSGNCEIVNHVINQIFDFFINSPATRQTKSLPSRAIFKKSEALFGLNPVGH